MTSYYQQPAYLAPQTRARSVDINTLNDAAAAAFSAIPLADQAWSGNHVFTPGHLRARMPVDPDEVATKAYADSLKYAASGLPAYPVLGSYSLLSIDGALSWEKSQTLQNTKKIAQAIALQFALS